MDATGLGEGDQVTVEVLMPSPWRGILLIFGVPLVALMIGLVVGSQWTPFQEWTGLGPEGAGLAAGGALGALAFALAWVEERRFEKRHRPRVTEIKHIL